MSEPDSAPRRRPPTIDLTAQEVETAQQGGSAQNSAATGAANEGEPGKATAGAPRVGNLGHAAPYAIGAGIGAAAIAALVALATMAGLMPTRDTGPQTTGPIPPATAAPPAEPDGRTAASADEISSRLDKIQKALQTRPPDAGFGDRMAAEDVQMKSLGDSLAALTRRVDEAAAASQAALAQGKAAAAAADEARSAAGGSVARSDVDALTRRIAALESAIKLLSADVAQRTSSADDRVTRAVVAAEALRSAVERSAPFQAELAAVKSLGIGQEATAPLEPFAASGIPSATALGRELTALTPLLVHASSPAPSDGSFLARLEGHVQKLVHVTPADVPAAAVDDDASAIGRISADAARGDVAAALPEIARLPDAARALADGWVKKAEARQAAIAASRRIATDALAALGKPVAQ
jgi:hypothetical protein